MGRALRTVIEGGIYHVYNRIARGEPVFQEDAAALSFLSLLRQVKERDGLTVLAWCLMSNHYHFALRIGPVPLGRSLKSLQHRFTQRYNHHKKLKGPLWQSRYQAKLIEEPPSLLRLVAYIHLNPVSARVVDDPGSYPYSGHREVLRPSSFSIVDVDELLLVYGDRRGPAMRAYRSAVHRVREEPWLSEAPGSLPWWRRGGPIEARGEEPELSGPSVFVDELGRSTGLERPRLTLDAFLELALSTSEIGIERLRSQTRMAEVVTARELIATLAVERYGIKVKDIAAAFDKSLGAASLWVGRGSERRRTDAVFSQRLEELDRMLAHATSRGRAPSHDDN